VSVTGAATRAAAPPAVRIEGLTVTFGGAPAVADVALELPAGTITGLVGESGSGKSTLALALLGAVTPPGRIERGSVRIDGVGDVLGLDRRALRRARGAAIGYVFQAAQSSLNPLRTVGKQLLDLARAHRVQDVRALVADAHDLLARMGLDADRVLRSYQHELSGGMRQRVGIMLALVLNAHLLVLDEPTTALDMITQANILRIIAAVHAERGLTTLVVTHDVGVVGEVAQRLAVMYAGRIVEQGETAQVLAAPRHPYTRGLVTAIPRVSGDVDAARPLPGRPPTLGTTPTRGCVFRERCPQRMPVCDSVAPPAVAAGDRVVACHAVNPEHPAAHPQPATADPRRAPDPQHAAAGPAGPEGGPG
jgi:peptide/nickel transport system ATP-binding protein